MSHNNGSHWFLAHPYSRNRNSSMCGTRPPTSPPLLLLHRRPGRLPQDRLKASWCSLDTSNKCAARHDKWRLGWVLRTWCIPCRRARLSTNYKAEIVLGGPARPNFIRSSEYRHHRPIIWVNCPSCYRLDSCGLRGWLSSCNAIRDLREEVAYTRRASCTIPQNQCKVLWHSRRKMETFSPLPGLATDWTFF